ncbi:MAG TPA: TRAP transporter substrate-binding protein [Methylomirabilota bacterium]|jgi:TRAP-type mannitol/chloroaromatic compound transport system substrate-binding protein
MQSRLVKVAMVAGIALVAAYVGSVLTTPAEAQRKVHWKMASAFGSKLPHLGTSATRFSDNIKVMSGGSLELKFFEPGALVPALECFDAVSKGSVESCWTTPGYHTGKYPALAFFTTVPFGPQLGEFLAWKWFGGGNELRNEIYAKHNLFALDCFAIGPETSGWFRKEVKNVNELKGIKMRFFGLGAQVMQKLGVNTQLMAAADIYPALERGVIDATEFSMPTMDLALGFHQIAKNNYYPGWHQQVSVSELLMNKAEWDKLSDQHKRIIQVALNDAVIHTYVETEAKNPPVMQEMKDKHKVTNRRWSDEDLKTFEKGWLEVLESESAKDPLFKKVADHYLAWRKTYKIWGDAQELKNTYQK